MNETEFWALIDASRVAARGDADLQPEELLQRLDGFSERDLEDFASIYRTLHTQAYRHDV